MLAGEADVVLVLGSQNSSNSQRLAELARERRMPAYLIDGPGDLDPAWFTRREDGARHGRRQRSGGSGRGSAWIGFASGSAPRSSRVRSAKRACRFRCRESCERLRPRNNNIAGWPRQRPSFSSINWASCASDPRVAYRDVTSGTAPLRNVRHGNGHRGSFAAPGTLSPTARPGSPASSRARRRRRR